MIIRAVTKHKTKKQYRLFFDNGKCLVIDYCYNDYSQGISQWSDFFGINDLDMEAGQILDQRMINYSELPSIIQAHYRQVV